MSEIWGFILGRAFWGGWGGGRAYYRNFTVLCKAKVNKMHDAVVVEVVTG